ncbi:hypothetical protein V7S43_008971 [Phytophthora oleae]
MCASDPKKRITLSEASQELKRLGYGNRASSRSRNSSSKDLEALEADAAAKVDQVAKSLDQVTKSLDEVSQELRYLSNESRSRGGSVTDLKAMEADAVATVEHVSTSLDEVSQELKEISDRSRNGSATDLREIEEQASHKLVCVSSLLNIASQELKRLGMGDKVPSESRNSSTLELVAMAQKALAKLTRLSSEGSTGSRDSQLPKPDQECSGISENEVIESPTEALASPAVQVEEEIAAATEDQSCSERLGFSSQTAILEPSQGERCCCGW